MGAVIFSCCSREDLKKDQAMAHKQAVLLILIGILSATPALSDDSVQRGKELAEEYCVRCHDTSPAGAFKTYPPSFASIAAFRSEGQIRSRIMFQPIHIGMPRFGLILMPEDLEPLVAFIQSLERKSD